MLAGTLQSSCSCACYLVSTRKQREREEGRDPQTSRKYPQEHLCDLLPLTRFDLRKLPSLPHSVTRMCIHLATDLLIRAELEI